MNMRSCLGQNKYKGDIGRLNKFCDDAADIFRLNDWKWSGITQDYYIPDSNNIKAMIINLVKSIQNTTNLSISSGRISLTSSGTNFKIQIMSMPPGITVAKKTLNDLISNNS